MGSKRTGIAGVVAIVALAIVSCAATAPAFAAKKTAVVHFRYVLQNDGSTTSEEWRFFSKVKACATSPRLRQKAKKLYVSFNAGPFGLYPDPAAAPPEGDNSDGFEVPESAWLPYVKVGPGHYRWSASNSSTFRTTYPDGRYAGTYPISYWWYGRWHSNFFNGPWSGSKEKPSANPRAFKVFPKPRRVRCVLAEGKTHGKNPPWPSDADDGTGNPIFNPSDQGTPVPSIEFESG